MEIRHSQEQVIYSDELMNMVGRTPSWILRWGNTMFFLFILVFVGLAYFVRYPEVIKSRIVITTPLPPAPIVALSSGHIDSIAVADHGMVAQGSVLAILKSPVRYNDVQYVKRLLLRDTISRINSQPLHLGSIQFDYNNYVKTFQDLQQFVRYNPYQAKIKKLESAAIHYRQLLGQINNQVEVSYKELAIVNGQFYVDSSLYLDDNTISKRELEASRLSVLSRKNTVEANRQNYLRTQLQLAETEHLVEELKVTHEHERLLRSNAFSAARKQLESQLAIWESNHVLTAPMAGKVSFFNYWTKNQFVKAGEEVFTIIPSDQKHVIGKIIMPTTNSGKVEVGQKVMVRLDGFPYKEFGLVRGKVESISLVPKNNMYAAEVSFENGLTTTYQKTIKLNQEMAGEAEIITEELRLIHRILYQFKDVLLNNTSGT